MARWYDNGLIVRMFGQALGNSGYMSDETDFLHFLREPREYADEYRVWRECGTPVDDDDSGWADFCAFLEQADDEDGDMETEDGDEEDGDEEEETDD